MIDMTARDRADERSTRSAVWGWMLLLVATGGVALVAACGGEESTGGKGASAPGVQRNTVLVHEACNESGAVKSSDANQDGKPEVKRVLDGAGREVCRVSDLNNDGHADMYEYFDASGQLRRREFDYDDNGVLNAVEIFQGGKLVQRELDTSNRGRIDTWDYFDAATGKRTKRERDATGDGRVDQWWLYEEDRVTIAMDRNGDGNPDPQATIVLDKNGTPIASGQPIGKAPATDAGAEVPPPPPPPEAPPPSAPDSPSLSPTPDAGAPGKPKRTLGDKR